MGSCQEAEDTWRGTRPDVAILDYNLPDGNALRLLPRLRDIDPSIPVIILTAFGAIDLAVEAIKAGATQFLTKPVEFGALLVVVKEGLEIRRSRHKQMLERQLESREGTNPFFGKSTAIRTLEDLAHKVAGADCAVLIQGETGTGKGILAHWIHANSHRASEPFVDLNCGGLSHDFLETELFGHEKGAFTGAVQSKAGLLEIAHKGTVFLDEIGDVDLKVQPKLVKVLEEKQFRRLGETKDRRVDIRLVAATHRDMASMLHARAFRSDLYFRISAVPLLVPPLRERMEDIPMLAEYLLERLCRDLTVGEFAMSTEAIAALQRYSWPGNIRELRNVLERAVLLREGNQLTERDLHFDVAITPEAGLEGSVKTLEQMERDYIKQILNLEGGRVAAAAGRLGIPRSSLYQKIKAYGIMKSTQSTPEGFDLEPSPSSAVNNLPVNECREDASVVRRRVL
jgi:DNA-binding NtrC family response regulator